MLSASYSDTFIFNFTTAYAFSYLYRNGDASSQQQYHHIVLRHDIIVHSTVDFEGVSIAAAKNGVPQACLYLTVNEHNLFYRMKSLDSTTMPLMLILSGILITDGEKSLPACFTRCALINYYDLSNDWDMP